MLLKFMVVMKKYKTCKGTAKNTVKTNIRYGDYNQVVETNEVIRGHLPVLGVKATRYIVPIVRRKV